LQLLHRIQVLLNGCSYKTHCDREAEPGVFGFLEIYADEILEASSYSFLTRKILSLGSGIGSFLAEDGVGYKAQLSRKRGGGGGRQGRRRGRRRNRKSFAKVVGSYLEFLSLSLCLTHY
jgi:hypothetical protein